MSKEKTWCDWSDLFELNTELKKSDDYKHNPTALFVNNPQGIAPKGEAAPRLAKGEVPVKPTDEEIRKAILHNAPRTPSKEDVEMHLLRQGLAYSPEQLKAMEEEYETRLVKSLTMPEVTKFAEEEQDWGTGKSFNSTLSREELLKRNMDTGE